MPLIHSFFEGAPGAYLPFPMVFPFSMFKYTRPHEEGALLNPEGAAPGQGSPQLPSMCNTYAVFTASMLVFKAQIQKILGVSAPASLQQQAAMASASTN
ncbi:integral membrane protein [Cyclospora cayetanensis]|nr:integral membrane protein [Cyclospora cayetanensis]